MKILKLLIILCSLLTFFSYADDDYEEHHDNHIHKNLEYLDLNPSQYEQIKEVLISYKYHYHEYYKKRKKKQKKLQKLFKEEKFDTKEYEEISKDIFEEAIELEAKTLKKIHKILNKNQRKKFSKYLKEWQVD